IWRGTMPLPDNHPVNEVEASAFTSQLGATPAAAYVHVPKKGQLMKVGVAQSGAVTGTSTVTVAIAGNTVATIAVTGGAAGSVFSAAPSASTYVNEDDVIVFTPAGGTGSATGNCFAKVRG